MERKTFSKVQIYVRDSYNRAAKMAAKGDYAGAVDTLLPVIKDNPEALKITSGANKVIYKEKS